MSWVDVATRAWRLGPIPDVELYADETWHRHTGVHARRDGGSIFELHLPLAQAVHAESEEAAGPAPPLGVREAELQNA